MFIFFHKHDQKGPRQHRELQKPQQILLSFDHNMVTEKLTGEKNTMHHL